MSDMSTQDKLLVTASVSLCASCRSMTSWAPKRKNPPSPKARGKTAARGHRETALSRIQL